MSLLHPRVANPFRVQQHGKAALILFVDYLAAHPALVDRARHELRGAVLGCWCRPGLCHGDVLAHLADGRPLPDVRAEVLELVGGEQLSLFRGGA